MVRRTEYAKFIYIAFALIVLMMNWESNKTNAAVAASGIPQESIRVRILGNSDNLQDQAVKKIVRDRVVEEINGWVTEPHNLEMAREDIRAHLGELDEIVGRVLQEKGFGYGHKVELDTVPFPEKMYGGQLYPAGSYEALRITLGSGQGKNWWCVLFPPLCFGDAVKKENKAEAAPAAAKPAVTKTSVTSGQGQESKDKAVTLSKSQTAKTGEGSGKAEVRNAETPSSGSQAEESKETPKMEARSFFWDLLKSFFGWIKGLFA